MSSKWAKNPTKSKKVGVVQRDLLLATTYVGTHRIAASECSHTFETKNILNFGLLLFVAPSVTEANDK